MTAIALGLLAAAVAPAAAGAWQKLAPGVEVGRFGDPPVVVVRVDPARHEFRLLSAKALGLKTNPTAPEWVQKQRVTGAINASMYQRDHLTSVAYMRDGKVVNNRTWNKDKAVFVSQPLQPGLPPVQILDRTCQDAPALARKYRVAVQSIRMIDCGGRNVWAPQERKWSTACVGIDGQGRPLLIHVRAPHATHDLIDVLLRLPLGLKRLMYVEGGPEASLYVEVGGKAVVSEVGSIGAGFWETDASRAFWPLPNVIAFAAR